MGGVHGRGITRYHFAFAVFVSIKVFLASISVVLVPVKALVGSLLFLQQQITLHCTVERGGEVGGFIIINYVKEDWTDM